MTGQKHENAHNEHTILQEYSVTSLDEEDQGKGCRAWLQVEHIGIKNKCRENTESQLVEGKEEWTHTSICRYALLRNSQKQWW